MSFSSTAAFEWAMFPAQARRDALERETPAEAGARCAGEACDAVAAQRTTVNGVRPTAGEPRELPVVENAPRLGRAILNGIAA